MKLLLLQLYLANLAIQLECITSFLLQIIERLLYCVYCVSVQKAIENRNFVLIYSMKKYQEKGHENT